MTTVLPAKSLEINHSLRAEWLHTIAALEDQIADWVRQEPGWDVDATDSRSITEDGLGTYTVPILTLHTPEGRLIVEPIARNFPGRGIVEFYAWPTLFRVRLLRGEADADWQVRVDSGFLLHQEWSRSQFIQLAHDLLGAS